MISRNIFFRERVFPLCEKQIQAVNFISRKKLLICSTHCEITETSPSPFFFRQINIQCRNNFSFFNNAQCGKVVKNTVTVLTEKSRFFPSNQRFYFKQDAKELLSRKFLSVIAFYSTFPYEQCCSYSLFLHFLLIKYREIENVISWKKQ